MHGFSTRISIWFIITSIFLLVYKPSYFIINLKSIHPILIIISHSNHQIIYWYTSIHPILIIKSYTDYQIILIYSNHHNLVITSMFIISIINSIHLFSTHGSLDLPRHTAGLEVCSKISSGLIKPLASVSISCDFGDRISGWFFCGISPRNWIFDGNLMGFLMGLIWMFMGFFMGCLMGFDSNGNEIHENLIDTNSSMVIFDGIFTKNIWIHGISLGFQQHKCGF